MPQIPQGTMEEMYPAAPRPAMHAREIEGAPVSWAEMDATGSPPILFVHGSPGDWKAWARYLVTPDLASLGTRVAMDRPGYGGSAASGPVPALADQARRILPLADPSNPPLVVGHSLGGAIALRMAIDDPSRVRGVLLIAASVSSQREDIRWYNRAGAVLKWLLPDEWNVSNREMWVLKPELATLEADLGKVQCPVILLQGLKDDLVDPRTADDVAPRLAADRLRVVKLPEMNHFVLWEHPEIVTKALLDLAEWTCRPATAGAASRCP